MKRERSNTSYSTDKSRLGKWTLKQITLKLSVDVPCREGNTLIREGIVGGDEGIVVPSGSRYSGVPNRYDERTF